ncbi:barstar family protein [Massilia sp. W12]|uniref:barstar family protein n=1 Tax=Massilia sp. W12 TaxID=3126507 RepID=UPI0030D425B1
MASTKLDGKKIRDWDSFHDECQQAFGFPDYYGRNMDAWVDCLSYLRDDDGMTRFKLNENEKLEIVIDGAQIMRERAPDILEEITYCVGGINERYEDYGEKPALQLVLR